MKILQILFSFLLSAVYPLTAKHTLKSRPRHEARLKTTKSQEKYPDSYLESNQECWFFCFFFFNFIWYKSSFLQHLLIFLTFCNASNICSVIQTSWCESEVIPSCITIASIAKNPTRWTCRATQSNTTLVKVNDKPFPPFLPLESHHITEQPRKSWK